MDQVSVKIKWPSERKVHVEKSAEKYELINNNTFLEKLKTIFFHPDHFQVLYSGTNRQVLLPSLLSFPFGRGQGLSHLKTDQLIKAVADGIGFRLLNGHIYFKDLAEKIGIKGLTGPYTMNFYYSSTGEPSLPLHSDHTDILVLQVFGSKRWLVGGENYLMEPGMTLFIPKGESHKVIAETIPSLHISISSHEETLRDHLINLWNSPLMDKPMKEISEEDMKQLLRKL